MGLEDARPSDRGRSRDIDAPDGTVHSATTPTEWLCPRPPSRWPGSSASTAPITRRAGWWPSAYRPPLAVVQNRRTLLYSQWSERRRLLLTPRTALHRSETASDRLKPTRSSQSRTAVADVRGLTARNTSFEPLGKPNEGTLTSGRSPPAVPKAKLTSSPWRVSHRYGEPATDESPQSA
jgi:hypothetical protein